MEKNPKCSRYDLRALEDWLAECAADGLELAGEWKQFNEGEKQGKQFCIEPAQENAEPPQSLRDSRALLGWEYVCSMDKGAFYVWRSVGARANPPRPRELAGSWCDKRLGRHLLNWWLGELAMPLFLAALAAWYFYDVKLPLWTALVNANGQWSVFSLLVGFFCALWATRREHRNLLRLRRAVRAGEYQEPVAQHKGWYRAMNWLPTVVAVLVIFLPLTAAGGDAIEMSGGVPYITAEELGGAADAHQAERHSTLLCAYAAVREGELRGFPKGVNWVIRQTQLEVYEPRIGALAKPLTKELKTLYAEDWQAILVDGIDETYYSALPSHQCLLLRKGGIVLLYHTDAPDDLRQHTDEFAELLETYRDIILR